MTVRQIVQLVSALVCSGAIGYLVWMFTDPNLTTEKKAKN